MRGITARHFGPGRRFVPGPVPWLEQYFADLSGIYGVGLRPGFLDTTTRNSYAEMAAEAALRSARSTARSTCWPPRTPSRTPTWNAPPPAMSASCSRATRCRSG
ncbi:hypothetical protein ABMX48_10210 [Streptomyces cavourensis]